jgi:hypothetical protein
VRKYILAVSLTVAFVTPAVADDFYVALKLENKKCVILKTERTNSSVYKMLGKYASKAEAEKARDTLEECKAP